MKAILNTGTLKAVALTLAVALVPLSVGLVLVAKRHDHRAALDRSEQASVAQLQSVIEGFRAEASGAAQLMATNSAFNDFLQQPGPETRGAAGAALSTLAAVYPGTLVRAQLVELRDVCSGTSTCGGAVLAYTPADGVTVPGTEVDAFWFATTTNLRPGQVLETVPFADGTNRVVGFSTVVDPAPNTPRAVIQFELPVSALAAGASDIVAASRVGDLSLAVIDASGKTVLATGKTTKLGLTPGQSLQARFAPLTQAGTRSGVTTLGGQRVAYAQLPASDTNQNGWTIAALAPAGGSFLAGGLVPFVLVAVALGLLGFALTRRGAHEGGPTLVDPLTGLGNRQRLELDLARLIPQASDREPLLLALLDLEGFKVYNDSFGRTAGDALLSRLGKNLAQAVVGRGTAYRMGGDEFCIVVTVGPDGQGPVLADAAAALSERGEGFAIASDQGTVLLPQEASDVAAALRIADQRLYAGKASDTRSAGRQSADVLLQALYERSPELGSHLHDVALLAREVGKRLGMTGEELDQIAQAAELHDVGKMAIPDAILKKPGPLDHEEWEFIRGHTIIGERIVSAAPALAGVAKLIRSSHERYNGTGYPDALKADEIPLGARVVAVCDAYDAMIGPRPYRLGLSKEDAISELQRCANAQFDPVVVDVFCTVVDGLEVTEDEDEAVIASRQH